MPPKLAAAPPSIEEATPSALDALFPPWADGTLPVDKDAGECKCTSLCASTLSCSSQYTHVQVHIRTPLARVCLEQRRALWMLGSDQVTATGSSRVVAPCNSQKRHAHINSAGHGATARCMLTLPVAPVQSAIAPGHQAAVLIMVTACMTDRISAGELASNVPDVPMVSLDASGAPPGSSPAAAAAGADSTRALRGELFTGHGAFEWLCATFTSIRTVQVQWMLSWGHPFSSLAN